MFPICEERGKENKSRTFEKYRTSPDDDEAYIPNSRIFSGYSNMICKTPRLENSSSQNSMIEVDENKCCEEKEPLSMTIRRKSSIPQIEPFQRYVVPDLVLETIFSNLNKRDLCSTMRVCHRFYQIGNKCNNWKSVDLSEKRVHEVTLAAILQRNVLALRVSDAKVDPSQRLSNEFYESIANLKIRLRYLDASRAFFDWRQLYLLINPCSDLTCLSLESHKLNDDILKCVAKNKHLYKLDLSMSNGLTVAGVSTIVENCRKLEELNISWCGLDTQCCEVICKSLPSSLDKLNISGTCRNSGLADKHLEQLAKACPLLSELDISDNIDITQAVVPLLMNDFKRMRVFSCSRCYGIDPNALVALNLSHIKFLNIHGCVTENNMDIFKQICNNIEVNKSIFNYTAKPTIPGSSYKIWGYPMSF